jgi:hypothetical protein
MGQIMPTERCSIGVSETNRAFRMAKEGHNGPVHIFKHMGREGLQLRVQRNTAAWVVRYKDMSLTIGYLYPERSEMPLGGHTAALDLAADVKSVLIDQPEKRDEYLLLRYRETADAKGKARRLTHGEALAALRPNSNTWTFKECVDQMVHDRQQPESDDPLKPSAIKDINLTFGRPAFSKIMETPASMLTRAEFETARDEVRKASGVSAAKKAVAWSRSVFGFMAKNHSGQSGIDGRDPWWTMLNAPYKIKERTRKPSIEDMVKSLLLAEEYLTKPLPGRMVDKPGVGVGTLAGLWWLCLTCQRADAGMSLLAYDLAPDGNKPGWLAAWDAGVMKGGSAHLLPIPERAVKHIEGIRKAVRVKSKAEWAFPSERNPEVHASASGVYRILYRLAGRDEVEVKKPEGWEPRLRADGTPRKRRERGERRNLLEELGISWWSLHDVRRTLQETLDAAGIPGGTSVILAHDMKSDLDLTVSMTERQRDDFLKNRVARITNAAYGAAQFLSLKSLGMQVWTDALLDEYEKQKAELTPVNDAA